jgi:hypothetical protein
MKLLSGLFVTLLMSMSMLGCGAPDDAPSAEPEVRSIQVELSSHGLTPKEGKTVLKLVDDICGDTWCEGDHNFHFDRIECTRDCVNVAGTCRLAFRIFPSDSDLKTGPTYSRSCQTSGFNGFASLVDTAGNGYQSLNWEYYDSLSACINEVESQLPAL